MAVDGGVGRVGEVGEREVEGGREYQEPYVGLRTMKEREWR